MFFYRAQPILARAAAKVNFIFLRQPGAAHQGHLGGNVGVDKQGHLVLHLQELGGPEWRDMNQSLRPAVRLCGFYGARLTARAVIGQFSFESFPILRSADSRLERNAALGELVNLHASACVS